MPFRKTGEFLALLLIAIAGCSGSKGSSGAIVSVVNDRRDIDLGKLSLGNVPKYTFAIRNTTDSPFKIISIHKSCGCQTADIAEGMIVPKGGQLLVTYSLTPYGSGEQTGRLELATDSSAEEFKEIVLTLRAQFPRKLWTSPESLKFDTRNGEVEAELRVESELPGLLNKFQDVTTCRQLVAVRVKEKNKDYLLLSVSLSLDAPIGNAFDYIVLRFDDPRNSLHTVWVRSHKESTSASDDSRKYRAHTSTREAEHQVIEGANHVVAQR